MSEDQLINFNQDGISDAEIIKQILSGDKQAFEIILNRYQRPILGYLCRLLNFNQSDAEDALAETFLKLFLNLASYNPNLKFSSWLYRIAHNEAVNIIRKKSKYYVVEIEKMEKSVEFENIFDRKHDLEKILKSLSLEDKNILTLFYLEGLNTKQIAEIMKTTTNNISVKLNRARNRARKNTQN
jgi:RNA polymerase sigma-70 factor, ECF subfamily